VLAAATRSGEESIPAIEGNRADGVVDEPPFKQVDVVWASGYATLAAMGARQRSSGRKHATAQQVEITKARLTQFLQKPSLGAFDRR
jgi:hypothetical protein